MRTGTVYMRAAVLLSLSLRASWLCSPCLQPIRRRCRPILCHCRRICVPFVRHHRSTERIWIGPYTLIAIAVAANGTIIYYDHWEDGYEPDVTNRHPEHDGNLGRQ